MTCVVCGKENCMEDVIKVREPKRNKQALPRVPQQIKTLGTPGYKKPSDIYDPRNPHINFVKDEEDEDEEEVEEETKETNLFAIMNRIRKAQQ